jgi:iron complex transport system permease protein
VVWPALGCLLLLFALLPLVARPLRQLELGDDVAAATGVRLTRERAILIGMAVALVSAVTAVAGPIAFIALAAPQIARRLTRSPGIPLVATALVGGVLLLGSDLVAQHLIPLTVPVGVVTVVIGGLYLTQLLLRERRR